MLCSRSRLNSSPVITVRKRAIRPPSRRAHLLWVPGWQTSESGGTMPGREGAEQLDFLSAHDVRLVRVDKGHARNDGCAALFRPDELRREIFDAGGAGDVGSLDPAAVGSDHPGKQQRPVAQPFANLGDGLGESALGNAQDALVVLELVDALARAVHQIGAAVRRAPIGCNETFCPAHASVPLAKNRGNATLLRGFLFRPRSYPGRRAANRTESATAAPKGERIIANFMFATGIENSIPTINNGKTRVDQMEACGHYERWREDFDCVQEIGINYLRYGPPIHKTYLGPGQVRLGIRRHHLRGAEAARHHADRRPLPFRSSRTGSAISRTRTSRSCSPTMPAAFAERFPWVQLYTPVNEMFICAIFSAKYGWWNEQLKTDQGFVTALKHIVKANVLAMLEILKHRADAIFIQSESSEYFHADSPAAIHQAELMNSRRFLSLDLNYGRRVDSDMYEYLMD